MQVKHVTVWAFTLLALLRCGVLIADDYTLQRQQMISDIDGLVLATEKHLNKKFSMPASCFARWLCTF